MIDTIIFDMDGTLVDTEKLAVRAWVKASDALGLGFNEQDVLGFIIGRTKADILENLTERFGSRETAERLFNQHQEYREQLVDAELEAKPGAAEVLDALKAAGYTLGLASSSHRPTVNHVLELAGLDGRFDAMTCGEEVKHGKPDPESFTTAAQQLGADPARCAVVEDSYNGVKAGHAAGMKVVMIPDLLPVTEEIAPLCDAVLSSLYELPEALKSL